MLSDQERQEDEMFAIKNICNKNEFRYNKKANTECSFSISFELNNENLLIKYNTHIKGTPKKLYIKYLPPVRLYVQLPQNYPSTSPPKYNIAINWLPPWDASLICQKLDELWQENEFNEILFIWLEFLKNDLLSYLNLNDVLEISYLLDLFQNPDDEFLLQALKWTDTRVVYGGLFLNPIERLLDYNEFRDILEFEDSFHECDICFATNPGRVCIRINVCKHVFCKNCIVEYLTMKINERNVNIIKCPAFDCKINIKFNQIKDIVSSELFQKYEKYLLEIKLLNRRNLVYCPRKVCQTPVFVKDGESLASCPVCEYNFCAYCFKVYHGIAACAMDSEEKLKLVQEYENADLTTKKYLEKKYGKTQIRQTVEKQLTSDYLQKNTKLCPTCGILTTKITGCNLMSCLRCWTNFCWLCNSKIVSKDEYDHFKSTAKGPCTGRLFEGIDESDENNNEFDGFAIMPNWDFHMINNV